MSDLATVQRLARRRQELVRRHELLMERVARFPNETNRRQLDELTLTLAQLDRRLHGLQAAAPTAA